MGRDGLLSWVATQEVAQALREEAERLLERSLALEDDALHLCAESADLENLGLERVAAFEVQRAEVLRVQARMHAAEVSGLDDLADLCEAFGRAESRKRGIWDEVERLWELSRRCLERSREKEDAARRVREEALRLLEQADGLELAAPDPAVTP
jgi:hypothetical protein